MDEYSRTNLDNVWAIGDVTDRIALTPVAIQEAMALYRTEYLDDPTPCDHANVPSAVFSQRWWVLSADRGPGRELHGTIDIYRSTFTPMKLSLTGREEKTMMKIIVDRVTQKVLGVHMVGFDARRDHPVGIAIAVEDGATKRDFDRTVGIHPTAAEEFVTMREKAA